MHLASASTAVASVRVGSAMTSSTSTGHCEEGATFMVRQYDIHASSRDVAISTGGGGRVLA